MDRDTTMVKDRENQKTLYVVRNKKIVSNAVNGSLEKLVKMVEELDRKHPFLDPEKTLYLVNRHTADFEAALPLIMEAVGLPSDLSSDAYNRFGIDYRGPSHHTLRDHPRKLLGLEVLANSMIDTVVMRMKVPDSANEKAAKILGQEGSLTRAGRLNTSLYDTAGMKFTVSGRSAEEEYAQAKQILRMLESSPYITIAGVHDYYANPKSSGFRSLNVTAQYMNGVDMKLEFQIQGTRRALLNTLEHKKYGDRRLIENNHGDLDSQYQVVFVDNRAVVDEKNPNVRMLFKDEGVTAYNVNNQFGQYTLLVVPGAPLTALETMRDQASFFKKVMRS